MRRAAKVDANQGEIVDALRSLGASVLPLHAVGQGCPDLLVGWQGRNLLAEVKDGSKPPSQQKLTGDQPRFHNTWRGQVAIINSVDAAMNLLGHVRIRGQVE